MRWSSQARDWGLQKPMMAALLLLGTGCVFGAGIGFSEIKRLNATVAEQQLALEDTRREAQREVNALAVRLSELQVQANRLNALGERLTRIGQLADGEFDFSAPAGVGGVDSMRHDMPVSSLLEDMGLVERDLGGAGAQLSVLEALLFDQQLERAAVPSRSPVLSSYVTSAYGFRADPFGGGRVFHRGIDFDARLGESVMAVADGVVSYSAWRAGYGNTVEVDHGNGYVTRYAHNTSNAVRVGDLVRAGDTLAKAGSTGRSTGVHVHLEVWENGRVINPRQFLDDIGPRRQ